MTSAHADVTKETVEFPVDAEHTGLRSTIAAVFIILTIGLFLLIDRFVPAVGINLLALLGALAGAAGITYVVERQLKARWKSGRVVRIAGRTVNLIDTKGRETPLPLDAAAQLLRWRFRVTKRARVPKGWYVVATALQHGDDDFVTVYTLMSPDDYDAWDTDQTFTLLEKPDDASKDLRLAGEQRRLHRAESMRWHEGVEMNNTHFMSYVDHVERLLNAR